MSAGKLRSLIKMLLWFLPLSWGFILSLEGMNLSINTPQQQVEGSLRFSQLYKWPDQHYSAGSMGYFNFISVTIQLEDKLRGNILLKDIGMATGIEYGGEQMQILDF